MIERAVDILQPNSSIVAGICREAKGARPPVDPDNISVAPKNGYTQEVRTGAPS